MVGGAGVADHFGVGGEVSSDGLERWSFGEWSDIGGIADGHFEEGAFADADEEEVIGDGEGDVAAGSEGELVDGVAFEVTLFGGEAGLCGEFAEEFSGFGVIFDADGDEVIAGPAGDELDASIE